jgi:hypothetical protein
MQQHKTATITMRKIKEQQNTGKTVAEITTTATITTEP